MAINGRQYGTEGPRMPTIEKPEQQSGSQALNLGKVFGIMFIWLLATAGIAFLGGYLFSLWMQANLEQAKNGLLVTLIASGISLIIVTFIIHLVALRKNKGMLACSIIYVILMGILLSSFTLFIPWNLLAIAFGITTVIFGVLALIGILAKGKLTGVAVISLMLILGGAICALGTWIALLFIRPSADMVIWYWVIDFAIFAGMLLMIIIDINQMKRIVEQGQMSNNLTIYFALTLYTDFVYIFIKIVYYLALAYGRSK